MSRLAPLRVDPTSSCYQLVAASSERMAVRPPGHWLREIDHVGINRFVERGGVTYYVMEVFLKNQRTKSTRSSLAAVGLTATHEGSDEAEEVLIDVDLNAAPAFQIERRFSEFEALRNQLSVCFESLHSGSCRYCDAFTSFLSCSSKQPGIYTKLTTGPAQRRSILSEFVNTTIRLALSSPSGDVLSTPCDGWTIIPQVVESFLRSQ